MTSPDSQNPGIDPVMVEALEWLARLRLSKATTTDAQALRQWRSRSPAHETAFREVVYLRKLAVGLPPLPAKTGAELARLTNASAMRRRTFLAGGIAIAASVAGIVAVRPPLDLWPSLAELMADHRTGAGQRFSFAPSAGVDVEMNSRTSVSLTDAGHQIRILDGEAFISVAERGSDFVAITDGVEIITRQARFNLKSIDGRVCVTCADGRVTARAAEKQFAIGPDEQIVISNVGDVTQMHSDASAALAWRSGLLVFDGTPLSEVVADVNRYITGRIILTNNSIRSRPVNGVFHTAQIENTVIQIQELVGARITRLPGGVVLLS